jgi:hypothetical protein
VRNNGEKIVLKKIFFLFLFLGGSLTSGCFPSKGEIAKDFNKAVLEESGSDTATTISKIYSGEGDSDNVYNYVEFDVEFMRDISFKSGWFSGFKQKKGTRLCGGKAEMLYQKNLNDGSWKMTYIKLEKNPAPCADSKTE